MVIGIETAYDDMQRFDGGDDEEGGEETEDAPATPAAAPWHIGAYIARELLNSRLEATAAYLESLRAAQQRRPVVRIAPARRVYQEAA